MSLTALIAHIRYYFPLLPTPHPPPKVVRLYLAVQPQTKLLREFHLFSKFCAIQTSPLNRKSKPPPHPQFKVVLL